jgi:hypothetical protein
MNHKRWSITGIVLVLLAAGCQPAQQAPQTPSPDNVSVEKTETVQKDPQQIALAAKEAMFKSLSARLLEVMSNGGPAAAIEVCSREAPRIADRVGKDFGLTIGRTSFKLRNTKNVPPEWVKPLIEDRPKEPCFVALPENHTGALFPIMLKVQCLACHGPKEQIAADVLAQLNKLYPDDQAVDFNEGDLRGWFWVDVPDRSAIENPKAAEHSNE